MGGVHEGAHRVELFQVTCWSDYAEDRHGTAICWCPSNNPESLDTCLRTARIFTRIYKIKINKAGLELQPGILRPQLRRCNWNLSAITSFQMKFRPLGFRRVADVTTETGRPALSGEPLSEVPAARAGRIADAVMGALAKAKSAGQASRDYVFSFRKFLKFLLTS